MAIYVYNVDKKVSLLALPKKNFFLTRELASNFLIFLLHLT